MMAAKHTQKISGRRRTIEVSALVASSTQLQQLGSSERRDQSATTRPAAKAVGQHIHSAGAQIMSPTILKFLLTAMTFASVAAEEGEFRQKLPNIYDSGPLI